TPRGAVRRRRRHRARDRLLDHAEYLCGDGRRRFDRAGARGVGAEHPVQRGSRVPAADGADLRSLKSEGKWEVYRCKFIFLIHTRPDEPGFVFVVSTTKMTLRTSSSTGRNVRVTPTCVRSSK